MLLVFHRFVNLKGLLRGIPLMDHLADGLGHTGRTVGLEDISSHIHAMGANDKGDQLAFVWKDGAILELYQEA